MAVAAVALAILAGVLAFLPLAHADARRRWLGGAPAPVDVAAGLAALPRRYLRDLHEVVARRPAIARAHVAGAGGFLAAAALVVLVAALPATFLLPTGTLPALAAVVAATARNPPAPAACARATAGRRATTSCRSRR